MLCCLATEHLLSLIDAGVALGKSKISENFHLNVQICLIGRVQYFAAHGAFSSAIFYFDLV
jgi:hypothetical protein